MIGFPKRVVDRRPKPTEKQIPLGISVSKLDTKAWLHNKCKRPVELYADYSAWCPYCKESVQLEERTEVRGKVQRVRSWR